MTRRNRGLQCVRATLAAELLAALQRCETTMDEELIPAPAVLIEQQDWFSRRADSRVRARCLDLHQRNEAVHLRLLRHELGQDAAETERIFAELRSHPVVTGSRRVALVEDEVENFEHGRQAGGELGPPGDLEGDARLGERPLGPDDSLRDGRLRDEEGARDLLGGQASKQPERERNARLGRENRMTGSEYEAQEVVADVVVDRVLETRHANLLPSLELATELLVFALEQSSPAQQIDRTMLCGGHEPGARVVWDTRFRPALERDDESILREILGNADIPHDPRKPGDEPRRLDSPDRVDREMGVGSRHGYRSHHHQSTGARLRRAATTSSRPSARGGAPLVSGVQE